MRTAVISDIHGNLEAFTTVIEDMQSRQVDRIVSLGDNIGYGADSEKVIQLLISQNIFSVLGNHEMAALNEKVFNTHHLRLCYKSIGGFPKICYYNPSLR